MLGAGALGTVAQRWYSSSAAATRVQSGFSWGKEKAGLFGLPLQLEIWGIVCAKDGLCVDFTSFQGSKSAAGSRGEGLC